jgi:hypothetical protein
VGRRKPRDPRPAVWTEVPRVLKPGAALVAFGARRTYHRGKPLDGLAAAVAKWRAS